MFSNFKVKKEEKCSTEKQNSEHNCCSTQPKGKSQCPSCSEKAKKILAKTVEALLNDNAKSKLTCFDGFHYCKTPSCKTVYFRDDAILRQEDMRVIVGLKDGAFPATICYCFEWTKEKIQAEIRASGKTVALEDIKIKMQNPGCSCEILNPSGGCCLGDVSKVIKELS